MLYICHTLGQATLTSNSGGAHLLWNYLRIMYRPWKATQDFVWAYSRSLYMEYWQVGARNHWWVFDGSLFRLLSKQTKEHRGSLQKSATWLSTKSQVTKFSYLILQNTPCQPSSHDPSIIGPQKTQLIHNLQLNYQEYTENCVIYWYQIKQPQTGLTLVKTTFDSAA